MKGDKKHRSHLPIPTPERTGLITYDAKEPDTQIPANRAIAPSKGCAQRAADPDRRRRVLPILKPDIRGVSMII